MLLATAVIVCFFFLALSVLLRQHNFLRLRAQEQHASAGASSAAPGSFMRHYLNKIPFPLPLRTKDDLINAGDALDKEDLTPFTRGYRRDQSQQPKPQPTPTATAVLNYLIQVFLVSTNEFINGIIRNDLFYSNHTTVDS